MGCLEVDEGILPGEGHEPKGKVFSARVVSDHGVVGGIEVAFPAGVPLVAEVSHSAPHQYRPERHGAVQAEAASVASGDINHGGAVEAERLSADVAYLQAKHVGVAFAAQHNGFETEEGIVLIGGDGVFDACVVGETDRARGMADHVCKRLFRFTARVRLRGGGRRFHETGPLFPAGRICGVAQRGGGLAAFRSAQRSWTGRSGRG